MNTISFLELDASNFASVTTLTIDFASIKHQTTAEEIDKFATKIKLCKNLTDLTFYNLSEYCSKQHSTAILSRLITAAKSCANIKKFSLFKCKFNLLHPRTRRDILQITSNWKQLEKLYYCQSNFRTLRANEIELLSNSLKECFALRKITIAGCELHSLSTLNWSTICRMIGNCENLTCLDLSQTNLQSIKAEEWETLALELSKLSKFKKLVMNNCNPTNFTFIGWKSFIKMLSKLGQIEEFCFGFAKLNLLTPNEWLDFGAALAKTKISSLDLHSNQLATLNYECLEAFSKFIESLRYLTTINLNWSYNCQQIEQEAPNEQPPANNLGYLLCTLVISNSIQNIKIAGTTERITIVQYRTMCITLPMIKGLISLDISENFVSRAFCQELLQALPKCYTLRSVQFSKMMYECSHGNYGCREHHATVDDFCMVISMIPNLNKMSYLGEVDAATSLKLTNNFITDSLARHIHRSNNLQYIFAPQHVDINRLHALYYGSNRPLLLHTRHAVFTGEVTYNIKVVMAWYASIAYFFLENNLPLDIIAHIVGYWMPPNPEVFKDLVCKSKAEFISFSDYNSLANKNSTSQVCYEPLSLTKMPGKPLIFTTKRAFEDSLIAYFDSMPDEWLDGLYEIKSPSPRV